MFVLVLAACFVLGGGKTPFASAAVDMSSIDTSIQGIIGTWSEGDVMDARTLKVNPDYTYELSYKGGGTSFGTIRVIAEEHPDGSYSPWFVFDENDGTNWTCFAKTDEDGILQEELWSGQDGAFHFIRCGTYDYKHFSESIAPKDYLGVWACGRCNIVIDKKGNAYVVDITWANSAAEHRYWTYSCRYDKDNAVIVCPGNGICNDCIVYENGKESDTNVYSDGSCVLILRNGVLKWVDRKDNAGADMEFLKVQALGK
ncbi:hypothetical protein D081_2005 [Anaerovibrio sp. JC8]|nr:hypothetical protein D081_2005 [Anaerovibrio sp. JC8]